MTRALGTRRGSADSTPSTSVQMWISAASSSAPKIDAEKSLPLRPSVVCTPCGSRATKPGITSVPSKSAAALCVQPRARGFPVHHRAELVPLHHHARRGHRASAPAPAAVAARGEVGREQAGGPQLAVAGHHVAHVLRGRAHQAGGVQHAFQIGAIAVEARQPVGARRGVQQRLGDDLVPLAQRQQLGGHGRILPLGQVHQAQQHVGHALGRGQHHGQPRVGLAFDDVGHLGEALGVVDAGAAELVDDPGGFTLG